MYNPEQLGYYMHFMSQPCGYNACCAIIEAAEKRDVFAVKTGYGNT